MTPGEFLSIAPMFASDDVTRPQLHEAFRHGHNLFVTDGRIALVCDASGLDADDIGETDDEKQRSCGESIIKKYIEPFKAKVDNGQYREYGLASITEAVCAAFANIEPEMMRLRANEPDEDDPDADGSPDSVRDVHHMFTAIIMPNHARSVISGYYASLVVGLMKSYGPVAAYADPHNPHAPLYFCGEKWDCALMPRLVKPRGFNYEWNYYGGCAIGDAWSGKLVWGREGGSYPDIDELRFGKKEHPHPQESEAK